MNMYTAISESVSEYTQVHCPIPPEWGFLTDGSLYSFRTGLGLARNGEEAVVKGGITMAFTEALALQKYLKIALGIKIAGDLIEKHRQLYLSLNQMSDHFFFRYPVYRQVTCQLNSGASPSVSTWWNVTMENYRRRIVNTTLATCTVFGKGFELSASVRDFKQVMQEDKMVQLQVCSEMIDKWDEDMRKLGSNMKLLRDYLVSNKAIGNRICNKMGLPDIATQILSLEAMFADSGIIDEIPQLLEHHWEAQRAIVERGDLDFSVVDQRRIKFLWEGFVPYVGQPVEKEKVEEVAVVVEESPIRVDVPLATETSPVVSSSPTSSLMGNIGFGIRVFVNAFSPLPRRRDPIPAE